VFRALRKVFASFYNDNAVVERLRHRVNEADVGMAVLVHYSFPDEIELANGVATAAFSRVGGALQLQTTMVTQLGAVSVANPEGDDVPEVVELNSVRAGGNAQTTLHLTQRSSLLPAGRDFVLAWEAEYREFQDMFFGLAEAYAAYFTNKETFTLDFEYKKASPDWLVIKQIRELPAPPTPTAAPILLNEPLVLQVSQGPRASVFANHRLKSLWTVETDNRRLDADGLATCFFTRSDWINTLHGAVQSQTGPFSEWEGARHIVQAGEPGCSVDRWTMETDYGRVLFAWKVSLPKAAYVAQCPIFTLRDLKVTLTANYPTRQMIYDSWNDRVAYTTSDVVELEPAPPSEEALPEATTDTYTVGADLQFDLAFYIKPEDWPAGMTGYTPTIWRFEQTLIDGLLPDATLRLQSYWSQTCQTYHKPYRGDFLFEPELEPDLPPAQLQALQQRNIRIIFLRPGRPWEQPQVKIIGFDGALRDWP